MKRFGLVVVLVFALSLGAAQFPLPQTNNSAPLGRPTLKTRSFDDIREAGIAKKPQDVSVVEKEIFADELIVEIERSAYSPLSLSAAHAGKLGIKNLEAAVQAHDAVAIEPLMRPGSYPYTEEDIESQRKNGLDRFYGIKFRPDIARDKLNYWYQRFKTEENIFSVNLSPVFRVSVDDYNDPLFPQQWDFFKVSALEAHRLVNPQAGVKSHAYVFVDDTGFFLHEEFQDKDGKRIPNIFFVWNAAEDKPGSDKDDDHGHSTHVGTTICAQPNNGKGIVGLAWWVNCGFVKTLIQGSGSWDMVARSLMVDAAKAREIKKADPLAVFYANYSLGGAGRIGVIDKAVKEATDAGVLVIAAAGNSSVNIDENPFTPASSPGVLPVVATDQNDNRASFSNYGVKTMTVAAPGVQIWAGLPQFTLETLPDGTRRFVITGSTYAPWSGTSMATPHEVAYAAAVGHAAAEKGIALSPEQVRNILLFNNDDVAKLTNFVASGGRMNMALGLNTPRNPPVMPSDWNCGWGNETHSSGTCAYTSLGDETGAKLAGAEVYLSEEKFGEDELDSKTVKKYAFLPLRRGYGEQAHTLIRGLKANTPYYARLRVLDRGGNHSSVSSIATFRTNEAEVFALRTFDNKSDYSQWKVDDGLSGEIIKIIFGKNPLLWHVSDIAKKIAPSPPNVWRYGNEKEAGYTLDQPASAMIQTEIFDVTEKRGLSLSFRKNQWILNDFFGADVFRVLIKVLDPQGHRGEWKVLRNFSSKDNNSIEAFYDFEEVVIDLSEFTGTEFMLGFDMLSLSSGEAPGILIDNVEVRIDKVKK